MHGIITHMDQDEGHKRYAQQLTCTLAGSSAPESAFVWRDVTRAKMFDHPLTASVSRVMRCFTSLLRGSGTEFCSSSNACSVGIIAEVMSACVFHANTWKTRLIICLLAWKKASRNPIIDCQQTSKFFGEFRFLRQRASIRSQEPDCWRYIVDCFRLVIIRAICWINIEQKASRKQ